MGLFIIDNGRITKLMVWDYSLLMIRLQLVNLTMEFCKNIANSFILINLSIVKYENGQQVGLMKYKYFNGDNNVEYTQTQDQEELDIINKLNHSYFLILLKTKLNNWKLINETQNRRIRVLYDTKLNKFEYGHFLNQQLDGKGDIEDLKNGQLNGIGIFYNKSLLRVDLIIMRLLKQSYDPIQLRNQQHQITMPDLICKHQMTPINLNNYYSIQNFSSKQSKSISSMRTTIFIKKQNIYSLIKNYPEMEYKVGSIQSHFGKDDLNIIDHQRNKNISSYIKKSKNIDEYSVRYLHQQLFDDE